MGNRTPLAATLAANSISTAGTSLTLIGVPWFVLETTGSAGRAGIVAFCATLPIVVAALIGGPVIDRFGRRRTAVVSDAVCAAAIAAIPLLHFAGALDFWMLCALMALNGFAHTPGNTARYVLIPDLAEHAGTTLPRAASLFDAVSRGARMVGAALAGVLIAFVGAETVLLLDAATFGLSALLIAAGVRGVRAAEPREAEAPVSLRAYGTELREGYAHLLGNRLLLAVVVMVMFMNGTDQGWNAVLLPVHAEAELGGATHIGLLTALFGAGGLTGALLYGAVGHRFPRRAVFTVCVILCGAPRFLVAAVTGTTLPLAVTMLLGGIAGGVLNPILTTVIYERVPDRLRSRVSGARDGGLRVRDAGGRARGRAAGGGRGGDGGAAGDGRGLLPGDAEPAGVPVLADAGRRAGCGARTEARTAGRGEGRGTDAGTGRDPGTGAGTGTGTGQQLGTFPPDSRALSEPTASFSVETGTIRSPSGASASA
ncbi:Predicted arabinose efflux permease, MFS family [Streptomyces sp. Ncost-T6T-2b]|nr:Predicted arabinose efflux permease, MFS family [Streptomyces sp. Ncost-T6T-2b]